MARLNDNLFTTLVRTQFFEWGHYSRSEPLDGKTRLRSATPWQAVCEAERNNREINQLSRFKYE